MHKPYSARANSWVETVFPEFDVTDFTEGARPLNFINGYQNSRMMLLKYQNRVSFGNAMPTDSHAQWRVFFDSASGLSALRNEGSGYYVNFDSNDDLYFTPTRVYAFRMMPPSGIRYPGVRFRGPNTDANNVSNDFRFLHIQNFRTYHFVEFSADAQASWGTPHWEPLLAEEAGKNLGDIGASVQAPQGYVRIFNYHQHETDNNFLMQNNRAIVHGNFRANDARTHWRFEPTGQQGFYYLINRYSGQYAVNHDNDVQVLDRATALLREGGAAARWQITSAGRPDAIMIGNIFSRPAHNQPFLNVSVGRVVSGLVSILDERAYWMIDENVINPGDVEPPTENVALRPFNDGGFYRVVGNRALSSIYRLQYYGRQVRLQDSVTSRFIFFDGRRFQTKVLACVMDTDTLWNISERLGRTYITLRGMSLELTQVEGQYIYRVEDAHRRDDRLLLTVFSARTATFATDISSTTTGDITIRVNASDSIQTTVPATNIQLPLRKGTNLIEITGDTEGFRSLIFHQIMGRSFFGASTNARMYQAQDMTVTNAEIILENRQHHTVASEAAERQAVRIIQTGGSVRWSLSAPANAIIVRASVPDSADGRGLDFTLSLFANGQLIGAVDMTSRYSWLYGRYGAGGGNDAAEQWTNDPSHMDNGGVRKFFGETRKILDRAWPEGTELMLRKEGLTDFAAFYYIDFVETHFIEEALLAPNGAVNILDHGAQRGPLGSPSANHNAFMAAARAAMNTAGRTVFIPEGDFFFPQETITFRNETFTRGEPIELGPEFAGLIVRGAGVWRTNIHGGVTFHLAGAHDATFLDIAFIGNETIRRNSVARSLFQGTEIATNGLTTHNIWVSRYKVGWWLYGGSNHYISGGKGHDLFADGINLTLGATNSVITQNYFRNIGDDAIAQWSLGQHNIGNVVSFNSIAHTWLANGIAVYGGQDHLITRNHIRDTIYVGAGINISTNFAPADQVTPIFRGSVIVTNNLLERTGSLDAEGGPLGAIWIFVPSLPDGPGFGILTDEIIIKHNVIYDSTFSGIQVSGVHPVYNMFIKNNVIDTAGTFGIDIGPDVSGNMTLIDNIIVDAADEIRNLAGDNMRIEIHNDIRPVVNARADRRFNRDGAGISPVVACFIIIGLFMIVGGGTFIAVLLVKRLKGGKSNEKETD